MKKKFIHPKTQLKKRVAISFSGGKTSAMMTKLLLDNLDPKEYEIVITFANTSKEHTKTLDFVEQCDKDMFNQKVVWLEAVVHHGERKSCTHRIVNYKTAKRKGEVFEDVIKKYGIPNQTFNLCNRELKINAMRSYMRSIGWKANTYSTAVGIRIDEIDRMSLPSMANGIFYPCIDNEITKDEVREFWAAQKFNLDIPEHWGNCTTCFKKSTRKLLTLATEIPEEFEWNAAMEEYHSDKGAKAIEQPRQFFRGHLTTQQLLDMAAKGDFNKYVDDKFIPFDPDLDVGGGCGASCEIGADGCEWEYEPETDIV